MCVVEFGITRRGDHALFAEDKMKLRRKMSHHEDDLQACCVRWYRLQYPDKIIYHPANGGNRNLREAARLKRQGVLSGVSDLVIPEPNKLYHGLFIELKVGKNKLTPAQAEFMEKVRHRGYRAEVCRTFEEFMFTVNDYLFGSPRDPG